MFPQLKHQTFIIAVLAVGVVVVTGSAVLLLLGRHHEEVLAASDQTASLETTQLESTGRPAVSVGTIDPGTSVHVDSVELLEPGFVVISEDNNRVPGTIIGASTLQAAGVHNNIDVETSALSDSQVIHLLLYKDNGDGEFAEGDTQVMDENGLSIEVVKNVGMLPMDHAF